MNFIHILDGQGHHISHLEHKQNALADSIFVQINSRNGQLELMPVAWRVP
jgi:hypothetical protein